MLCQSLTNFASKTRSEFPLLNHGGCAVFAAHVAKRLQHIVPTRIKLIDYSKSDLTAIRSRLSDPKNIYEWHRHGINFVHVIIEFDYDGKTYHYDSDGLKLATGPKWNGGFPISKGSFTVDEVISFAANPHCWNPTFNRSNIPTLKRRVKNLFARKINHNQTFDY